MILVIAVVITLLLFCGAIYGIREKNKMKYENLQGQIINLKQLLSQHVLDTSSGHKTARYENEPYG